MSSDFDDGLFDDDDDQPRRQKPKRKQIKGGVGDFDHVKWLMESVGEPCIRVMPVTEDKIPVLPKWTTESEVPSGNVDFVREKWAEYGEPNIGMVLGAGCGPRGDVVVEADNDAGQVWIDGNLKPTPTRVKSRRGYHNHMAHPGEGRVKNSADVLGSKVRWLDELEDAGYDVRGRQAKEADMSPAVVSEIITQELARALEEKGENPHPIIDIKADGGYTVGPGSRHKSGHIYTGEGFDPESWGKRPVYDASAFPERYRSKYRSKGNLPKDLEHLRKIARETDDGGLQCDYDTRRCTPEYKEKRARAYARKCEPSISGSGGHNALLFAACRVYVAFDLDFHTAHQILMEEFNPRCQPAWDEVEIEHKLEDADANASEPRGAMLVNRADFQTTKVSAGQAQDEPEYVGDEELAPVVGEIVRSNHVPEGEEDFIDAMGKLGMDWADVRQTEGVFWSLKHRAGVPFIPPTLNNLRGVIDAHPKFRGRLRYNRLRMYNELDGVQVTDDEVIEINEYLDYLFDAHVNKNLANDAMRRACVARGYDPILDYLDGLQWDGVERLDRAAAELLHVTKDEELAAIMVRKFFLSAAARALRPGCKVDTALILKSEQGAYKSGWFKVLFGDWFTGTDINLRDKDSLQTLGTNWCWEWAELQHVTNPKLVNKVKAFLSEETDRFRPPYARHAVTSPRRCVVVGSTNDETIVFDSTGARRLWIVCNREPLDGGIDLKLTAKWRDQLWAEACTFVRRHFENGDPRGQWWLTPEEDAMRAESEKDYQQMDSWFEDVHEFVESRGDAFTLRDVLQHLDIDIAKRDYRAERRVGRILKQMGIRQEKRRVAGARVIFFTLPEPPIPDDF